MESERKESFQIDSFWRNYLVLLVFVRFLKLYVNYESILCIKVSILLISAPGNYQFAIRLNEVSQAKRNIFT
jgi:hypothetical protein